MKNYRLDGDKIRDLATGYGACIASDRVTVDGEKVGIMCRQYPDNDIDSGWRFLAGDESDEYMDEPSLHAVFDVNTIANYDPAIIPYLDLPVGADLDRLPGTDEFVPVLHDAPDEED